MSSLYTKFAVLHKELMRRFRQRTKVASANHKLVSDRIPIVVDELIARNIVGPEAKRAMLEGLKDHAKCLLFISNLASAISPQNFGSPVKKAYSTGRLGERESDRIWKESVARYAFQNSAD